MTFKTSGRTIALALVATIALSFVSAASHASRQTMFREGKLFKGRITANTKRAETLLLRGKYDQAESAFRSAIARSSRDVDARSGLGMALAMQFKLDGADDQLDRALKLDPTNPLACTGKAMVLLNRLQSSSATVIRNRNNTLSQAEEYAKRAVSYDPDLPEAHYMLGIVNKEQGRLADSARELGKATALDPRYSQAFSALGMTNLAQSKVGEATSNFKHAITINSKNSSAHYGLGRSLLAQGRVDDAIKELNTALYLFRNSAPVHLALGECYQRQGNTVAAIREYQESIRIKPENADAYLHIADIREARGDLEHSIAELRSGIELNPNNPYLHQKVGDQLLMVEKLDDAIKSYRQSLSLLPDNVHAVEGLTRGLYLKAAKEGQSAFIATNDFESAEQQIQEAISLRPNDMMLRLADAKLRSMSGKPVDLSTIGTPHNDGERIAYAEALMAQNRFQEASDNLNIVINNANNYKQIFAVADLAAMIKDHAAAEAAYRKGATIAGGEARARRGLANVAKTREIARKDTTMAVDLARKGQVNTAVDKYRDAIYSDPRKPATRLGLAESLQKQKEQTAASLRDAAFQYNAFIALQPNMPEKERTKYQHRIERIEARAYKLENKALSSR
jgi:tetratricopeptide (TPR) repeat protein